MLKDLVKGLFDCVLTVVVIASVCLGILIGYWVYYMPNPGIDFENKALTASDVVDFRLRLNDDLDVVAETGKFGIWFEDDKFPIGSAVKDLFDN